MPGGSWVHEYIHGCCYEIYRFTVTPNLDGLSFAEAAQILQEVCNSILFAMLDDSTPFKAGAPDQRVVQLFPADRLLREGDYCYVLARNAEIVVDIKNLDPEVVQKFVKDSKRGIRKATRQSAGAKMMNSIQHAVHDVTEGVAHRMHRSNTAHTDLEMAQARGVDNLDSLGLDAEEDEDHPKPVTHVWDNDHMISPTTHHLADDEQSRSMQEMGGLRRGSVMAVPKAKLLEPQEPKAKSRSSSSSSVSADGEEDDGTKSTSTAVKTYDEFVDEEMQYSVEASNHIVLMGLPNELVDFIAPLRARHYDRSELPTVVVMSPLMPSKHHYETMLHFPDVHFIHGSPTELHNLTRASVYTAHTVIILANLQGKTADQFRDPNMVDADAITTLKFVSDAIQQSSVSAGMDQQPRVVTEIVQTSNLKYFTWMLEQEILTNAQSGRQAILSSQQAAKVGRTEAMTKAKPQPEFSSNLDGMGDRRTSFILRGRQKKKNEVAKAMEQLDQGRAKLHLVKTDRDSNLDYIFRPNFASGRVYLANLTDRLLSESFRQPQTVSIIRTLVCGDTSECSHAEDMCNAR